MAKRGSPEWRENIRASKKTHGDAGHGNLGQKNARAAEYRIWSLIVQRCTRKSNPAYSSYGGRGITVCKRWLKYESFLTDMGRRPAIGYSVERNNNDKGYNKHNCTWLPRKYQSRNRSTTVRITYEKKTLHLAEWARRTGMNRNTIVRRIRAGLSLKQVFGRPVRGSSKKGTSSK